MSVEPSVATKLATFGEGFEPGAWSEEADDPYAPSDWELPGMGDSGSDCQVWRPATFCDNEAHIQNVKHACKNRSCPHCWSPWWAREKTVDAVARLGAARHVQHPRAIHASVSPPEGEVQSKADFYRARRKAYDLAREHGVRGGLVIPHGYRPTDEAKREFRTLVSRGLWDPSTDGGIWRYLREQERDLEELVYWSPHFHIVGLAEDVRAGSDREDGWVFHNIQHGNSHSLEPFYLERDGGYEDMAKVVRYLLSHATYAVQEEGHKKAVTWFGDLSPQTFDPEEELSEAEWATIQRKAEEIVGGATSEDGEGGVEEDEAEECPVDGCDGELHPIWEAEDFLEQRGDSLSVEASRRLQMAYWWRSGDMDPPPGLKHPQTEEQAEEALEAMLNGRQDLTP